MVPSVAQHPPGDAGLLGHLAGGGLLERLLALHVALGQAPLDPARAVAAGDDRDPRVPPSTSTTTPPADTSSTAGSRRTCRDGLGTGELMCVTVTSGRVRPRTARAAGRAGSASPTLGSRAFLRPDQPAPAGGRAPARPRPAAPHRARRAVHGRRPRALAGRRAGAGRVPGPCLPGPGLHHRRDAGADRGAAARLGRRALGRGQGVRHDRRAQEHRRRHVPGRGDDVPQGRVRPDDPQARGGVRRQPGRRPGPPRLHRQRDGAAAALAGVRRPARRPVGPGRQGAAHARYAAGVVRRRPAADDAGGPVRLPARVRRGAGGRGGDDRHGRPALDRLGRADPRRVRQAAAGRRRRGPAWRCWSAPAWPRRWCPSCRRSRWRSTSTTGTRTSTSTR